MDDITLAASGIPQVIIMHMRRVLAILSELLEDRLGMLLSPSKSVLLAGGSSVGKKLVATMPQR